MQSLLWSVFYAVTLIGLLPLAVRSQEECWQDFIALANCLESKWKDTKSNEKNQRECCKIVDIACGVAKWAADECEAKKGKSGQAFEQAWQTCKNLSIDWSADDCSQLKPQIPDNCNRFAKWVSDCPNPKEVEAKALAGENPNPSTPDSSETSDTVTDNKDGEVITEGEVTTKGEITTKGEVNGGANNNQPTNETEGQKGKLAEKPQKDNKKNNKWLLWVIIGVVVVIIILAIVVVFYFMAQSKTNKEQATEAPPPNAETGPQDQTGMTSTEPQTAEKVPSAEDKSVRSGEIEN